MFTLLSKYVVAVYCLLYCGELLWGCLQNAKPHVTRKIDEQPLAPFSPTPESHRKSSLELLNAQVFRPPSTTNSRRKYRHHAKRSRTQYVCTYSEFRIFTNLRRARALGGTFYTMEKSVEKPRRASATRERARGTGRYLKCWK